MARRSIVIVLVMVVAALVYVGTARPDHRLAVASRSSSPSAVVGLSAASPSPGSPAASAVPGRSAAPFPLPTHIAGQRPVPILVYHHVTKRKNGDYLLYVSPAQLRAELAFLKKHGYRAVTLRQVYDAWSGQGRLPMRPVVLTFDDGYIDQVRNAGPILRRYHWPAELALVFNNLYKGSAAPPTCITPRLVQRLVNDGWGIESHTVSHRDLRSLSRDDLRHEFEYSRTRLLQIFGVPIDFVCYPGGNYNARVERAARTAGYLAATTIDPGAATPSDLYALPRMFVWWGESLHVFGERLRKSVEEAGSVTSTGSASGP